MLRVYKSWTLASNMEARGATFEFASSRDIEIRGSAGGLHCVVVTILALQELKISVQLETLGVN